jgi:hypothetical protein
MASHHFLIAGDRLLIASGPTLWGFVKMALLRTLRHARA